MSRSRSEKGLKEAGEALEWSPIAFISWRHMSTNKTNKQTNKQTDRQIQPDRQTGTDRVKNNRESEKKKQ